MMMMTIIMAGMGMMILYDDDGIIHFAARDDETTDRNGFRDVFIVGFKFFLELNLIWRVKNHLPLSLVLAAGILRPIAWAI